MKNINLHNLHEHTQKTSLTPEEKFDMLQNIRMYADTHPVRSYSLFAKHSLAYASICALLIGSGATSFAAEDSLPGDILYPIKINVNEELAKTFSVTKSKKAKTNVKLVEKRMSELTEMVVTEKDTPEKIDVIAQKLEEHKNDLEDFIEQVEEDDTDEVTEASEIYTELESIVEAHLDILEEIKEDEEEETKLAKTIDTFIESTTETYSEYTPNPEENTSSETQKESASMEVAQLTDELTGEEDAFTEVSNFSLRLESIITPAKQKVRLEDSATSTKIRADIRKKIIEETERELRIDLEEDTDLLN